MKKFYLPLIAGAMALSFAACGGQKSANGRESVELTGAGAHSLCHFIICLSKTTMQLLVTRFPMVVLVVAVVSAT